MFVLSGANSEQTPDIRGLENENLDLEKCYAKRGDSAVMKQAKLEIR